jgi:hypothetical protein
MGLARSSRQGRPSPNCRDPGLGQAGNQRLDTNEKEENRAAARAWVEYTFGLCKMHLGLREDSELPWSAILQISESLYRAAQKSMDEKGADGQAKKPRRKKKRKAHAGVTGMLAGQFCALRTKKQTNTGSEVAKNRSPAFSSMTRVAHSTHLRVSQMVRSRPNALWLRPAI